MKKDAALPNVYNWRQFVSNAFPTFVTPKILSNIRDYCFLTYIFSPAKGGPVRVERTRGKQMMLIDDYD